MSDRCSSACERKQRLDERIQSLRDKVNAREEIPNHLVGDPAFSDFQIRAQGINFHVAKYQLALKSRVFENLFRFSGNEVRQGVLELHDDSDAVKAVLDYIFMYKKVKGSELASKVLQLAHRCEMIELKEQCELELLDNLTVRDAPYLLGLARNYGLSILFATCVEYLYYNFEDFERLESEILPDRLARPPPVEARPAPPANPPAIRARRQDYDDFNNREVEQVNEQQGENDVIADLRDENNLEFNEECENDAENDDLEEENNSNQDEEAYSPEDLLVNALTAEKDQNEKDQIPENNGSPVPRSEEIIGENNGEVSDWQSYGEFREHPEDRADSNSSEEVEDQGLEVNLQEVEEKGEMDADRGSEEFFEERVGDEEQKEGILCRSLEELHIDDSLDEASVNDGEQDDESDSGGAADFEDEDEEETPPTSPLTNKLDDETQVLVSQNQEGTQNHDETLEEVEGDPTPHASGYNLPSPPVKGSDVDAVEKKLNKQQYGDFFNFNGEKVKVSPVRFARADSARPRPLVFPDTTEDSETRSEQEASKEILSDSDAEEEEHQDSEEDLENLAPWIQDIREPFEKQAKKFRSDEQDLDSPPEDYEEQFRRYYGERNLGPFENLPDETEVSAIEGDEIFAHIDHRNPGEMSSEQYQDYTDWKQRKTEQMRARTARKQALVFTGLYRSKPNRKPKAKPNNSKPFEEAEPKVEANENNSQASAASMFAPALIDPDHAPPLLTVTSRKNQCINRTRLNGRFSVKNQNTYPLVYKLYKEPGRHDFAPFSVLKPARSESVIVNEGIIFYTRYEENEQFDYNKLCEHPNAKFLQLHRD